MYFRSQLYQPRVHIRLLFRPACVLNEPYIHVAIASFISCIYSCLVCLLLRQAFLRSIKLLLLLLLLFKNELITWMYCWFVLICYFFQFSSLAIAYLFAFITPAGVFLERAIHACIICLSRPKFFPFCSLPVVIF